MEFAFHTRLDDLETCRALSRTSAGVARNARKTRRGALLCALLCAAWLATMSTLPCAMKRPSSATLWA